MSNCLQNVVILGGGSAGWMTAAYLSKALDKNVHITLIESSDITKIGVGEATFSTIKLFFDFLGLQEHEWMPKYNASYKMAIKFVNWNAQCRHFYHPFQRYETVEGFDIAEWWLKMKRGQEPFDYSCFLIPLLCDHQRSPRYYDGTVFDDKVQNLFSDKVPSKKNVLADLKEQYPYAYHFDANLMARFLKDYSKQRGVKQIVDDVVDVELTENGSINSLITKEHGNISGDLFIDCTGFRGLLINKVLNEPFISFSESLLCDRAIAMQVPTDIKNEGINPYTTATALSSGWVWNIPLYGRIGTGYVYCSQFLTQEQAEQEFRQHLGSHAQNCKASHIKIRVGRNRNSWVKNCVAIGLSSGFVEPLESTGIFFIQHGIEELINHFPSKTFNEELIKSYNKAVSECIDGVRNFLTIHYYASDRADTPFWKATKHEILIPEELREKLRLWKTRLPNNKNINPNYHGFESYSYSVMLLGLNYVPLESLPALDHIDERKAIQAFQHIRERANYLKTTLPSQYDYLTNVIKSQQQSQYLN
ncbi:tryptophan halogenase family protein [Oscillatoria salina]|uniref:tryptophan halogenase family protein n=1 Tax=Oscillatoria salina TaxID=331517 RepID=UPI0013BBE2DF|nr:tryptophan halogenase family protein [Oscillatoria salina]MBZ8183073.1 tryptophan 7-halogenase [Oscillatoria salina IIICB1]NET91275.1 tryptophan 7-halogenase [Kamptonema sp. SIO1D9]